jgi:hypothetical protein
MIYEDQETRFRSIENQLKVLEHRLKLVEENAQIKIKILSKRVEKLNRHTGIFFTESNDE